MVIQPGPEEVPTLKSSTSCFESIRGCFDIRDRCLTAMILEAMQLPSELKDSAYVENAGTTSSNARNSTSKICKQVLFIRPIIILGMFQTGKPQNKSES